MSTPRSATYDEGRTIFQVAGATRKRSRSIHKRNDDYGLMVHNMEKPKRPASAIAELPKVSATIG
jgi:hypothetical protein